MATNYYIVLPNSKVSTLCSRNLFLRFVINIVFYLCTNKNVIVVSPLKGSIVYLISWSFRTEFTTR